MLVIGNEGMSGRRGSSTGTGMSMSISNADSVTAQPEAQRGGTAPAAVRG